MALCPQTFFNELKESYIDQKKGPYECERLLNLLNRSFNEDQFDKYDLGK